jgi:flagellar biogenesis protein FliO
MSIADHFYHAPDAGFVRAYDSQAARRQFQVSLALILILALAAFALGMLVRFDEPASVGHPTPVKVVHEVHLASASQALAGDRF